MGKASRAKNDRRARQNALRPGLPKLPACMRDLEVDPRGYPIPWFVYRDPMTGKPDFRVIGPEKIVQAVRRRVCWVSGKPLVGEMAFVIGPASVMSQRSSEPPTLMAAARFASEACPFLLLPKAQRREAGLEAIPIAESPGLPIKRNPGVFCLWVTETYKAEQVPNGVLFAMGTPSRFVWYAEGRELTEAEVQDPDGLVHRAMKEALEITLGHVAQDPGSRPIEEAEVYQRYDNVMRWIGRGGRPPIQIVEPGRSRAAARAAILATCLIAPEAYRR